MVYKYEQQDAHEFLLVLIEKLEKRINDCGFDNIFNNSIITQEYLKKL